MTDRLKADSIAFLEATGRWPTYPWLFMKAWSDEEACYKYAVVKHIEGDELYYWFYKGMIPEQIGDTQPVEIINLDQVKKKIEQGWMVD